MLVCVCVCVGPCCSIVPRSGAARQFGVPHWFVYTRGDHMAARHSALPRTHRFLFARLELFTLHGAYQHQQGAVLHASSSLTQLRGHGLDQYQVAENHITFVI